MGEGSRLPHLPAIAIRLRRPQESGFAGLARRAQEENLIRRREELDRSIEHLHEANRQLAALDAELREHSRAIAHDARTPLFTILGALRHLARSDRVEDLGQSYLERALRAAHGLHEVTESLLAVARVGRHDWTEVVVSPSVAAREVVDRVAEDLAAAGGGRCTWSTYRR